MHFTASLPEVVLVLDGDRQLSSIEKQAQRQARALLGPAGEVRESSPNTDKCCCHKVSVSHQYWRLM